MKYINTYLERLHPIDEQNLKYDIMDICADLIVLGMKVHIIPQLHKDRWGKNTKHTKSFIIKVVGLNDKGLYWSEIKDVALRLKDYLGTKFSSFGWRPEIGQLHKAWHYNSELSEDSQPGIGVNGKEFPISEFYIEYNLPIN